MTGIRRTLFGFLFSITTDLFTVDGGTLGMFVLVRKEWYQQHIYIRTLLYIEFPFFLYPISTFCLPSRVSLAVLYLISLLLFTTVLYHLGEAGSLNLNNDFYKSRHAVISK